MKTTTHGAILAICASLVLTMTSAQAVRSTNGVPLNGMPLNGLPLNGLALNALTGNGLPMNGLALQGASMQGLPINGIPIQGMPMNGIPMNGTSFNGLVPHEGSLPTVQSERLPWSTLSQRPLGTTPPSRIGFLRPCSRYRLGPLCI